MGPGASLSDERIVFHCVARLFVSYHYIESLFFWRIIKKGVLRSGHIAWSAAEWRKFFFGSHFMTHNWNGTKRLPPPSQHDCATGAIRMGAALRQALGSGFAWYASRHVVRLPWNGRTGRAVRLSIQRSKASPTQRRPQKIACHGHPTL
jgi:hypothetical protein